MGWLQEVSRVVAKENLPLRWTTPAGFPVLQDYKKMNKSQIRTMLMGKTSKLNVRTADAVKIDSRKMSSSVAPNWVHSHDAAHLMLTVETMVSLSDTMPSFQMVHDSFGTHAADAGTLYHATRQAFCNMYSEDVLRDFYRQVTEPLPAELRAKVPSPPIRGNLDITQVLNSDYFFA